MCLATRSLAFSFNIVCQTCSRLRCCKAQDADCPQHLSERLAMGHKVQSPTDFRDAPPDLGSICMFVAFYNPRLPPSKRLWSRISAFILGALFAAPLVQ